MDDTADLVLRAAEQRIRQLESELAIIKSAYYSLTEQVENSDSEKIITAKDRRIYELESELSSAKTNLVACEADNLILSDSLLSDDRASVIIRDLASMPPLQRMWAVVTRLEWKE